MLNGSRLFDACRYAYIPCDWGVGAPTSDDLTTIQYVIDVIRDLKFMITPDVIAAYVASVGGYGCSVFGDFACAEKFFVCPYGGSGNIRSVDGISGTDNDRVPEELVVHAERYARGTLGAVLDYIGRVYTILLDRSCNASGGVRAAYIPNRLYQAIKLLAPLPIYWANSSSYDARCWTNIQSIIKDARATGLPTCSDTEYYNSAFGAWEPSGVHKSVPCTDKYGTCIDSPLCQRKPSYAATVNNTVKVDGGTVDLLRNALNVVVPRYEEDKTMERSSVITNIDFETIADLFELIQYFIGVSNTRSFGVEIYNRLIDKDARDKEDLYRETGYQVPIAYDEMIDYCTPLGALILARNVSSFFGVDTDLHGSRAIKFNLTESGGVPYSAKYKSVRAFLLREIDKQASIAQNKLIQYDNEARKERGNGR